MAQITSGIRAILSSPKIYNFFQNIMGAQKARVEFAQEYIRAQPGNHILDLGCGTAEILAFLPDVHYVGFDISEAYVAAARARFGKKGVFECRKLGEAEVLELQKFDIVLVLGVLHHLEDNAARALLRTAHAALRTQGRLVTIDPCHVKGQNMLARILINLDRGKNVRSLDGYTALAKSVFHDTRADIRHRSWIPYTHCIMECTK